MRSGIDLRNILLKKNLILVSLDLRLRGDDSRFGTSVIASFRRSFLVERVRKRYVRRSVRYSILYTTNSVIPFITGSVWQIFLRMQEEKIS